MRLSLTPKLIYSLVGLWFGLLLLAGLGVAWRISSLDDHDYPNGTVIEGTGRCGSTEVVQRGRSIRIERYRCVLTDAPAGEVVVYYVRNGYTVRNQGVVQTVGKDRFFDVFEVERVYLIDQKDGTHMVRIYDDTTIRAPSFGGRIRQTLAD